MSIWKNGKLVAGGRQVTPLLSFMWADHILDDISWLRADTFSWHTGNETTGVYPATYKHLADDIDGKTLQSETIGNTTIQFYLADDGHKICPASEESNVVAIYNATGVAWYYIIDIPSKRFKLPRTKWGVTGLRDTVGKYVDQDVMLPKMVGIFSGGKTKDTYTGPFYLHSTESGAYPSGTNTNGNVVGFDTSRLNSVYSGDGTDTLIQPRGTQMYLYFYVGEFTQTALENTAGITAETLNDKVDIGHQVIAFQAPTADNGYTWYRKYADGWVEQGQFGYNLARNTTTAVTLPVPMADTNYTGQISGANTTFATASTLAIAAKSTTQVNLWNYNGSANMSVNWEVKGIAA